MRRRNRQNPAPFRCQAFTLAQRQNGMKVTTDACLFAAWVPLGQAQRILDLGTGTGLIALFAAQRCSAQIDALEIDAQSLAEAQDNFLSSPWADRIHAIHADLRDFAQHSSTDYDLILCNPPFFQHSTANPCSKKALARHNHALSSLELMQACKRLLKPQGVLWLLISCASFPAFQACAQALGFHRGQRLSLSTSAQTPAHRYFVEWRLEPCNESEAELQIYTEHPHHSPEARALLQDFYLQVH